ncbi:CdaR family transcriptional regulator [Nocardia sp. BMG51109]|uniref:PucR family transcriptional regulator n=1 Tax=Nocardia sp. BMG51109 TaxID=1056816 RepID=UPI0004643AA3|nr:helix-turn-helix domain-containing protein [Nocardia sp. BMG51109]
MTVTDSVQQPTALPRHRPVTAVTSGHAPRPASAEATSDSEGNAGAADTAVGVVRSCMEVALDVFRGEDIADRVARLEVIARHWADRGIGLDRLQQAVHEGFRLGADSAYVHAAPVDVGAAMSATRRQLDVLESIHVRLTRAYTRQLPAPSDSHHAATRNLAVALLRGELAGPMARHCGLAIADEYHVVAMALPAPTGTVLRGLDAVRNTTVHCIDAALAHRYGPNALSLLGADGGTLLLPVDLVTGDELGPLVAELSQVAQCPFVAAALAAAPAEVSVVARQAHELLDTAVVLHVEPGLYRMNDLGLHFQLTRPGPGRDALRAVLAPLDGHPELLQTLARHLANNLNRQRTARELRIHVNTLDYRLKRIGQLTGRDPAESGGLWQLRSALVVRQFTDGPAMAARGPLLASPLP